MEASETTFTESSGNVFADLGLSDPETRAAKVYLGVEIGRIIKAQKWSQTRAAAELCIDQPSVSTIRFKDTRLKAAGIFHRTPHANAQLSRSRHHHQNPTL